MPHPPSAYDLHQQQRWTRHDAHLWLRHDYARWLKPGADPEELHPHLKREREAAESAKEDAVFDAWIENERRWIAAMREEVNELKAAQVRRRLEDAKYNPSQPRRPAGNPRGGQWTDRNGGASNRARGIDDPRVISDADPEVIRPGERYAQTGSRRGAGTILINGRRAEISLRQSAELEGVRQRDRPRA